MAVNMNVIAEKIMKFIRGNGLQVQMFDDQSGKSVADPTAARYFYVDDPNVMIFLDDKTGEMKFHMGEGISLEDPTVSKISKNMKLLARKNMLDFDIRTFGKRIEPRNYGYKIEQNKEQNVDDVFESISPLEGSSRTSRQTLENAKIIVRHRAPVNEEQRGSRSRNISAIFIENNAGERFKYPFKHLSGARAMARHVSSGGNPMDTTGSAIVEMSENLYKLKEFMGIVAKQSLINEANRDVVFNVKKKINHIKETISKLSTSRGYTSFVESLALNEKEEQQEISEEVINSYISKFTKSTFEESLKDILPLVHRVNEEEYRSNRDGQVQNIMQIISAKNENGEKLNKISFSAGGSYDFDKIKKQYKDTPQSQYAKMASTFQDLASRVDVDTTEDHRRKNKGHDRAAVISLFLNDISEKLDTNPKSITKPEMQLATYFLKLSKIDKPAEVAESLDKKFDKMLKESLSKYSVFEEFGIDDAEQLYEISNDMKQRYLDAAKDDVKKRQAGVTDANRIKNASRRNFHSHSLWMDVANKRKEKMDSRKAIMKATKDSMKTSKKKATNEAEGEDTSSNLQVWEVTIWNNYYRNKYADWSPRPYPVLATSADEAKQVVLQHADEILKDLLSKKLQNGKRVLPPRSALPITDKLIGRVEDGTVKGKRSTYKPLKYISPNGWMEVTLKDGHIVDADQGMKHPLGEHTDYQSYVSELRDEGYSVYVSKIAGGEGGIRFEIETPDGREFEVIEAKTGQYGLYRDGATMSGKPDELFLSLADAVHSMT